MEVVLQSRRLAAGSPLTPLPPEHHWSALLCKRSCREVFSFFRRQVLCSLPRRGNLLRAENTFELRQRFSSCLIAPERRGNDPGVRSLRIFLRPQALGVHGSQLDARASVSRCDGFLEPAECLALSWRTPSPLKYMSARLFCPNGFPLSVALRYHDAAVFTLRPQPSPWSYMYPRLVWASISLASAPSGTSGTLPSSPDAPLTLKKKNSEIVVRARKTLFGRCPQPTQRCPVVRGRSPAVGIHHRQINLGGRIPSLRCLLEPLQRFLFAAVRPNRQDGSDSQLVLLKGRPPFVSGFRPVLRFSNRAVRS